MRLLQMSWWHRLLGFEQSNTLVVLEKKKGISDSYTDDDTTCTTQTNAMRYHALDPCPENSGLGIGSRTLISAEGEAAAGHGRQRCMRQWPIALSPAWDRE